MNRNTAIPQILLFIAYFVFLVAIGILTNSIPRQPHPLTPITLFITATDTIRMGDAISFAQGAIDIYHNNWFSPENQWLIHLWPPGFMLTEAAILKIFGIDAPFILILLILVSLAGATLLLLMQKYFLQDTRLPVLASILPCTLFMFPLTRFYLLQPAGLVLGETIAIIFFLSGLTILFLSWRQPTFIFPSLAGILFALSTYYRSQFEILITFLTLGAIILLLYRIISHYSFSKGENSVKKPIKEIIKSIAVPIVICHLLMLPWRWHNSLDPAVEKWNWVSTENLTYANAGKTTEQLKTLGGGWVAAGGGNLACTLSPSYCGKTDKYEYYRAFLKTAPAWYRQKLALLRPYWFSSLKSFTQPIHASTRIENILNAVFLLCVLLNFAFLIALRHNKKILIFSWAVLSFYSCFFIIFTFVQFEVRYFYFIKIFALYMTIIMGATFKKPERIAQKISSCSKSPSKLTRSANIYKNLLTQMM